MRQFPVTLSSRSQGVRSGRNRRNRKEQGCQTDWSLDPDKHFTAVSDGGEEEKDGFGDIKEDVIDIPDEIQICQIAKCASLARDVTIDVEKEEMSEVEEETLDLVYKEEQDLVIEEREDSPEERMEDQGMEGDRKLDLLEKCDWSGMEAGGGDNGVECKPEEGYGVE